ncbi:hypothetical protein Tco_1327493 [Tanacetum coccineum]
MAPEGSRAVVIPKFDMHIYTFELTFAELKEAIDEYCIPLDLHPCLPHPGMTMNKLPSRYIGLYIEQFEQGGLRVPFSSFFLAVIRHFGVYVSQLVPMGVNRVIFFEIRCKKFFLLDRRAIPDAMPWRHSDTDLHDDFPTHFNENDVARLSEFQVPLRPPPRHLLYTCGLTMACRHSDLQYHIKDQDKNVINMDTFLKLPTWTRTVVSKGDPIPEDQHPKPRVIPPLAVGTAIPELTPFQKNLEKPNPKIVVAREKKDQQNLAKAEAKRAGAGAVGGPKKKRRVQKHAELTQSGLEGTLSATPIHQAILEATQKPVTIVSEASPRVEKEVVDLSGNTRVSTLPVMDAQPSPHQEHHDTHEVHSQSSHHGSEDEPELVSHLATPAEDEFLGALSNVEVISRAYQTLGQSVVAQGELLKRHEQLNHDYVDLRNRNDAHLSELDCLRLSARMTEQKNEGLTNKLNLIESAHFGCESKEKELMDVVKDMERERDEWRVTALSHVEQISSLEKDLEPKARQLEAAEERIRVLEGEKLALSAGLAQAEVDHQKLVREFIPAVVKRLHTSVEYWQTLAAPLSLCFIAGWLGGLSLGRSEDEIAEILAGTKDLDIEGSKSWEAKHRELFTKQYPYVQKVVDSYFLPMADLLQVSLDVPTPHPVTETPGSATKQTDGTAQSPRLLIKIMPKMSFSGPPFDVTV